MSFEPGLTIHGMKRRLLESALIHFHGNRTRASRAIGISIRTARNWINAFGLHHVGRDIAIPVGTRVKCPLCKSLLAEIVVPVYRAQRVAYKNIDWKPALPINGTWCPFPGCEGQWLSENKIFDGEKWTPGPYSSDELAERRERGDEISSMKSVRSFSGAVIHDAASEVADSTISE